MGTVKALILAVLLCAAVPASADSVATWRPLIAEASQRYNVPIAWIERVMQIESRGRTRLGGRPIVSPAGAMGLIVEGAGAAGCLLSFGQAFSSDPVGLVSSPDGIGLTYTISKTGISIVNNGPLATKKIYYVVKDVLN
jgi:hypothetical protein